MKRYLASFVLFLTVVLGQSALAAEREIGIVLLHGKLGTQMDVQELGDKLSADGYLVIMPEMPWSKARRYDRPLTEAHEEIDRAIGELRRRGAKRIVAAGHSMGANMTISYAATHDGLSAVMALGPGQTVEAQRFRDELGQSVSLAEKMIRDENGNQKAVFQDLHLGKSGTVETTAENYYSYFYPEGLANMPSMVATVSIPLLWTVGTKDANMLDRGRGYAFDLAPANPLNHYEEVAGADHMGTPAASWPIVRDWLRQVIPSDR